MIRRRLWVVAVACRDDRAFRSWDRATDYARQALRGGHQVTVARTAPTATESIPWPWLPGDDDRRTPR